MIGRCYDYTARSTSEMRCDLWHDSGHAGYTVQRQRTEACRCRQVNSKFKPIYQCKAHETRDRKETSRRIKGNPFSKRHTVQPKPSQTIPKQIAETFEEYT